MFTELVRGTLAASGIRAHGFISCYQSNGMAVRIQRSMTFGWFKRILQLGETIKQLQGTPLAAVGVELEKTLQPLLVANESLEVSGPVNHVIDHVGELLSALPK